MNIFAQVDKELKELDELLGTEQATKNKFRDMSLYDTCVNVFGREYMPDNQYYKRWEAELFNTNEDLITNHNKYVYLRHEKKQNKVFIKPRGVGKTTFFVIDYIAWNLLRDSNRRFLLCSKELKQVKKRIRGVKSLIAPADAEKRKQLQELLGIETLKPSYNSDLSWTQSYFTVANRTNLTLIDPSVDGASIGNEITGTHVDEIIIDDLITKKDYDSALERQKSIDFFASLSPIIKRNPDARIIVVGTRWEQYDLFRQFIDDEISGYDIYIERAIDENGEANFPNILPLNELDRLKNEELKGSVLLFNSQYQSDPTPTDEKIFNPDLFAYYHRDEIEEDTRLHRFYRDGRLLYPVAYIDPSESVGNDDVGVGLGLYDSTSAGTFYLMELELLQDPQGKTVCALLDEWRKKYNIKECRVEIVGNQRHYKKFLNKVMEDLYPDIQRVHIAEYKHADSKVTKESRIRDLSYYVHNELFKFPAWKKKTVHFVKLFQQFYDFPNSQHDDGIDVCERLNSIARRALNFRVERR